MSKVNYEAVLIFSVKNGEESVEALKAKFLGLISENGTLGEVDEWGKRKLAYLIDDEPEGYYCIVPFESEPEFPAELERVAGITDGVLRIMTVKKEA